MIYVATSIASHRSTLYSLWRWASLNKPSVQLRKMTNIFIPFEYEGGFLFSENLWFM